MGDYIRRGDAVDTVKHAWAKGIEPSQYIESLEPADVAPVVRCQNCEEYKVKYHWCRLHEIEMSLTDFCSYGERKD